MSKGGVDANRFGLQSVKFLFHIMFSYKMFTLEDPVHPLLGPTLWGLKYFVASPSNKEKLRLFQNILYLLVILMLASSTIEFYRIRADLAAALRNLSLTILAYITMIKVGSFYMWQKDWMSVMNYVSSLEKCQLNEGDKATKDIIKKYTKYSRRVSYCYWVLVTTSVTIYSFAPLFFHFFSMYIKETINIAEKPYPEIISTWVPFDKTKGYKYWIITVFEIFIAYYSAAAFGMYDSNVVALMSFFVGQLDILKLNCERLFGNGEVTISEKEFIKKIQKCHRHHILLVRNSKLLNSLLSPVMFQYIIVCSVMMCCNAVQLTMKGATIVEKAWVAEYLGAQIFQLFLFCWHSQKVLDMSLKVDTGVYSSAWWSQDVRVTRHVILLGGQLNQRFVFTAGPFANLNVATFVAILKGTYSYYTLLSNAGE